jgi:hypothetical protein
MGDTFVIAPCGLDCSCCQMYMAKESPRLRITIHDKTGIPIDEASCSSCRGEGGLIRCQQMTAPCAVFKCSQEKNVKICCDCDEFPCAHYQPYAHQAAENPHNLKLYNLCLIKKMGLEAFAKTMAYKVREAYFKGKLIF